MRVLEEMLNNNKSMQKSDKEKIYDFLFQYKISEGFYSNRFYHDLLSKTLNNKLLTNILNNLQREGVLFPFFSFTCSNTGRHSKNYSLSEFEKLIADYGENIRIECNFCDEILTINNIEIYFRVMEIAN